MTRFAYFCFGCGTTLAIISPVDWSWLYMIGVVLSLALFEAGCHAERSQEADGYSSQHDGDCSIYSSLASSTPYDGICTCGAGRRHLRATGDDSEMMSRERRDAPDPPPKEQP